MSSLIQDPYVWICSGAILIGLVLLVWAFGKLMSHAKTLETTDISPADLGMPGIEKNTDTDIEEKNAATLPFAVPKPPLTAPIPAPHSMDKPFTTPIEPAGKPPSAPSASMVPPATAPSTPTPPPSIPKIDFNSLKPQAPVNKDVGQRLETMTQKLSDMQSTLQKQAADPSLPHGPIGQGFNSETIDKLLHIVSNVTDQIELLQKGLGKQVTPPADSRSNSPAVTASPAAAATPPPSSMTPPAAASATPPAPKPTSAAGIPQQPPSHTPSVESGTLPKPTMPPPMSKGLPPLPGVPKPPSSNPQ